MSTDYAAKEREFLATLAADTGRNLDAWMAEISAKGLADKNDIIDWLRREGFPFWKASWLERVHHNGGRPLYGSESDAAGCGQPPVAVPDGLQGTGASLRPGASRSSDPPSASPALAATIASPAPSPASLEELLARAKAYRPLAVFLISAIARAVPEARFAARGAHITVAAPGEFAAIGVSARELRLGLALGAVKLLTVNTAAERLRRIVVLQLSENSVALACRIDDERRVVVALADFFESSDLAVPFVLEPLEVDSRLILDVPH